MKTKATYPGGKAGAGVYQRLINHMPPHETYIETHLGGGAVMRYKRPAATNIGIDIDPEVIATWQSRIATGDGGGPGPVAKSDGDAGGLAALDKAGLQLVHDDAVTFLSRYRWQGAELVYADPPYLHATRSDPSRDYYLYEYTEAQHRQLLACLLTLPCRVMISGYWSALYAQMLRDWCSFSFNTVTRGGKLATEWVWMNYSPPTQLHDTRFVGDGYRERERIKRKARRWKHRFDALPPLERQALQAAVYPAPGPPPSDVAKTTGITRISDADGCQVALRPEPGHHPSDGSRTTGITRISDADGCQVALRPEPGHHPSDGSRTTGITRISDANRCQVALRPAPGHPPSDGSRTTGITRDAGTHRPRFFIGSSPSMASRILDNQAPAAGVMVSATALARRRSDFAVGDWLMDSGAFTEVARHGRYRTTPATYAGLIRRWATCGRLLGAVAQDYMCEPFVLARTGLSVADHQRLTIERYDALCAEPLPVPVMPVLQGYRVREYLLHLAQYGDRLRERMWVGVGSLCRRNGSPEEVADILGSVRLQRPDLRLHGFGLKQLALEHPEVREALYSCDSMAWSYPQKFGCETPTQQLAHAYQRAIERCCHDAAPKRVPRTAGAGNGQGRKPGWQSQPTKGCRFPEAFVDVLTEAARWLDAAPDATGGPPRVELLRQWLTEQGWPTP